MIEHITIIIFSLALLMLSIRHLSVKRQIRNVKKQLQEIEPRRRSISIELIDRDVEALTLTINNLIDEYNQTILEATKNHQCLKGSIADISHDMRTPLTSTIGYLQLLSRSDLSGSQRQYLDIALEKSQYLRKLLEDFYELSALSANVAKIEFKKVDLAGVVSEVILDNAGEFAQSAIEPVFDSSDKPVFILGETERLQRIIQNLVSNCLKYSCGNVVFKIIEGDTIRLTIENPAVNAEKINTERLFERFYRADSSRSGQGTGLGLSITKLLTESIGGSISVHVENDLFSVKLDFIKFNE